MCNRAAASERASQRFSLSLASVKEKQRTTIEAVPSRRLINERDVFFSPLTIYTVACIVQTVCVGKSDAEWNEVCVWFIYHLGNVGGGG